MRGKTDLLVSSPFRENSHLSNVKFITYVFHDIHFARERNGSCKKANWSLRREKCKKETNIALSTWAKMAGSIKCVCV